MVNAQVTEAAMATLQQALRVKAHALGFASVGFAPAADDPVRAERLHEWLDAGMHGAMGWMADRTEVRQGPNSMWPEAQSVIALGMSYAPEDDPLALAEAPDTARISVYAQGLDLGGAGGCTAPAVTLTDTIEIQIGS